MQLSSMPVVSTESSSAPGYTGIFSKVQRSSTTSTLNVVFLD